MKRLNYQTLEETNYQGYLLKEAPERVIQFGEGNFMRAFVDHFIDILNEKAGFCGKVVAVQPVGDHDRTALYREQEGLYTLYLRGFAGGKKVSEKRLISCISRCLNAKTDFDAVLACAENPALRFITCNTTEAGIIYDPACRFTDLPPKSFPAKLTRFLYRRFQTFGAKPGMGFVILPCELIDDNGKALQDCVLRYAAQWELGDAFLTWIREENVFCSTLVDRIVTGYPQAESPSLHTENGYEDRLLDTGEVFASWVIEGPASLKEELPFEKAGLPVLFTNDYKPYKQRKVRILNGAHTSFVPGAYLAGQDIVRDCMADDAIRGFMNRAIYEEIIPTLSLPETELKDFAASVTERFKNPFIDHALLAISLNSTSKWKARVLPSLKAYVEKTGQLPACLTASFAFYLQFYRGQALTEEGLTASRGTNAYTVKDDREVLAFYDAHKDDPIGDYVRAACSNTAFWGEDLTAIPGFADQVTACLKLIAEEGAYALFSRL